MHASALCPAVLPLLAAAALSCSPAPTSTVPPSGAVTPPTDAPAAPPATPAPGDAPAKPPEKAAPAAVAWTPGLTGETAERAKQCDAGDYAWCMIVGNHYELGASKDLPRALAVYKLGCDGGDKGACTNVGRMTLEGIGTTADPAKGAEQLATACNDMGHGDACSLLAGYYEKGTGVAKDAAKAKEFFAKACDKGNQTACKKAGNKAK